MTMMNLRKKALLACVLATGIGVGMPVAAKTFHVASQGDIRSMDPYVGHESFTFGVLYSVYEPLVARDKNLKLVPALATSWENPSPTTWVFHLRKGVTFHNGNPFTADDVIFSWRRMKSEHSDMKEFAAYASSIRKIDDHTIEVTTPAPNPILPNSWTYFYIMDKEWAMKHGATQVADIKSGTDNFAILHENGTGPFELAKRQPGVKTVLTRYRDYWNKSIPTNVTRIVSEPIEQDSTRVAALLSGKMDLVRPIPVQDWGRLEHGANVALLRAPEARVVFIGFDQARPELLYSTVKGKNPFKDKRVREAFVLAVDTKLINKKIMRDAGRAAGSILPKGVNGYEAAFGKAREPDIGKAKALLAEAGYPDGFGVTLDCPNDRYVKDEQVCQAVASMLARIGVKVDVLAQTKSKFFAKTNPPAYDTSMYMLGWGPSSLDAFRVLYPLAYCRGVKTGYGDFNEGGYCNKAVDTLIDKIGSETDQAKRYAMITKAFTTLRDDYAYMPLYQPPLSWGVRKGIDVQQRGDGFLDMRYVTMP